MSLRKAILISLSFSALMCYGNTLPAENHSAGSDIHIANVSEQGKEDYVSASAKYYAKLMGKLYREREKSTRELFLKAAMLRQGDEYVGGTLEREPEALIVDLNHTDCILFVESCLALAQSAKSADTSYAAFCKRVQELRYRDGIVEDYASRIHYTSEWIMQAEENGFVKECTREIGGEKLDQKFSYMSVHSADYRQLASSDALVQKIRKVEQKLNGEEYYYIPKGKLSGCADKIESGDIIAFCTSTDGLDIGHVGIALWVDGELTFIHATPRIMMVTIEPCGLQQYLDESKSSIGIRVMKVL